MDFVKTPENAPPPPPGEAAGQSDSTSDISFTEDISPGHPLNELVAKSLAVQASSPSANVP